MTNKRYAAAIRFMADALAARDAVWWGCFCAMFLVPSSRAAEEVACGAAVKWVLDPSEDNRSAALEPGKKAGLGAAAGSLAMAATWTGGSFALRVLPRCRLGCRTGQGRGRRGSPGGREGGSGQIGDTQRLFVELAVGIAGAASPGRISRTSREERGTIDMLGTSSFGGQPTHGLKNRF